MNVILLHVFAKLALSVRTKLDHLNVHARISAVSKQMENAQVRAKQRMYIYIYREREREREREI